MAGELAVTQGHYSKVVSRQVPLSDKLARRMEVWLEVRGGVPVAEGASRRIHELATSIRRECMELMLLVGMTGEVEEAESLEG